jgi:hypothetical protein
MTQPHIRSPLLGVDGNELSPGAGQALSPARPDLRLAQESKLYTLGAR